MCNIPLELIMIQSYQSHAMYTEHFHVENGSGIFWIEFLQIPHSIDFHLQQGCHDLVKVLQCREWTCEEGLKGGKLCSSKWVSSARSSSSIGGEGEGQDPLHCKTHLYLVWINSFSLLEIWGF